MFRLVAELVVLGLGLDLRGDLALTASRAGDALAGSGSDLDLGLEELGGSDSVRFDATLALAVGGQVAVVGISREAGVVDARFELDGVDLEVLPSLLPGGVQIEGAVTEKIDIRFAAEQRIERFAVDLRIPELRLGTDLVDLSGTLSIVAGFALDGPVELDLGLSLIDGGRLDVRGTSSSQGLLDLELAMDQFDLALAQPFLSDPEIAVGGRATGTGRFVGAALRPEFVALDIGVEAGLLRMPEYRIDGPFLLALKIEDPFSGSPRGQLALDLTAATLEYADQFNKRAGLRAEIVTEFVPDESGVIVFESRIKLRHVDEILLRGLVGDSISVAITTPSFELDGMALRVSDGGQLRLHGRILSEAKTVRRETLKARSAGLVLEISGKVDDPFGVANYELAVRSANKAEINDLLSAFLAAGSKPGYDG